MQINYPNTRASDFVEELHGVQVPDPYRWMEDLDSPEVREWIEAQNDLTFDYLRPIPAAGKHPGADDGTLEL